MKPPSEASIVEELLLAHGAESAGLSASAPCASSGHVCGIKLGKTVVLSDLEKLTVSTSFVTPGRQRGGVSGVSISPDGSCIAAFSSDELYVAQMQSAGSVGSLQHVAQLAGIKAVHWCPGSTALAVCCKQQADINLLVLQPKPQQNGEATAAAQQPAFALAPLQRLPGPLRASAGARCAAWLPHSEPGGPAALLAAWPSDLLVYTWAPAEQGIDWSRHKVHRFLAGWPGPVRSIAVAACPGSSDSSLILGTVDAQLSLGFINHNSSTLEGIGIKSVSTAARQQATHASAAKELAGCSSRSGSPLAGGGVLRARPSLITPVRPRTATDTSTVMEPSPPPPPVATAAAGTSRLSSLLQSTGVLRATSSLITLLQPDAGAASSDKRPAAAQIVAGAEGKSVSAAAAHPSPYPDVDDLLTPRSLAQPVEPTDLSVGSSAGGSGGSSVLNSLMNITAQPASRSRRNDGAGPGTTTSSSGGDGSACLCMLQVRVSDFYSSTTSSSSTSSSNSTSSSPSSAHSPSSNANGMQASHQQSSGPLSNKAAKSSRRRLYNSALQLPHLPTPDLLALHDSIAAVGSSTGQPLVTLCSFAAPAQGLQLLQTVAIPLPSPYAQEALVKARLEGLLLTPARKQLGLAASSSSNAGTRYPRISDGCLWGAVDGDVTGYNSSSSSSGDQQQPLPEIVVLLSCFEVQQQGNFANIGSKAASTTADVFLMKCTGLQDTFQKTVPQYSRQKLFNQQLPHQQNVQAADEFVPLRVRMSASDSTAAAAAVREAPVEDCIWWQSAVQQADKDKQQQKGSGPCQQQQPSAAAQTSQQQQEQEHQQEQQGNSSNCQQPSSVAHVLQKLKQQEQKQLEQFTRHRELKHPSVVPGVGVGRSVSVETVGSYVSNGTTWTSLTEDYIHPQQHNALPAHCQYHHQQQPQPQPIHQQLQEHDDEFQAAVTRVNKVVAVLSSGGARLGCHMPAALQPDDAAGPAAPACSRISDLDLVVCPVDNVIHRTGTRSAPGYSGLTSAESAGLSRAQLRPAAKPLNQVELHSELTFRPVPGSSGLRTGSSPEKPAALTADQAGSLAPHEDADSGQHHAGALCQGGAVELHGLQHQLQLLQAREQARDEAATASRIAVAGLQTSLEQRLDALLQLQQQQLQQQEEMHRQQQKLVLAQAERESALASVLASFHTSMESRLDGVQELMRQMIKQLDRLATGIEEMEGS